MYLFAKIVYSLKSKRILTTSSILKSITWRWIYLGYFSDLHLVQTFLFLLTLIVNSAHKCLFKAYTRRIALGVGPVQIWQQGCNNNVCHVVLKLWVNFGEAFTLFLGTFIVDVEYSSFILNVIKYYLMA